jgi:hypothetical protein
MIKPLHYKLCIGTKNFPHDPVLLSPLEDRTGCDSTGVSCTVLKCQQQPKNILSFDYIPVMEQLKLLCKSRSVCHELLTM